jgi:hypothetical protein
VHLRRLALRALVLVALQTPAVAPTATAQEGGPRVGASQIDLEMYRTAISAERRSVMETNIGLDIDRRLRFFTLYDEFDKDRAPLDQERFSLVQRYASAQSGLSDPQAMALVRAMATLQIREIELRARHAGRVEKALGGKVAARFYQVDDVVTTATRLNSLQGIPLVGAPAQ